MELVDDIFLKRIGNHLVFMVRRRTTEGRLLPGSTSEEYSTKQFAMPFGALPKGLQSKAKQKQNKNDFGLFTTKSTGSLWVLVKKGYKHLRELAGKDSSSVKMTWSGAYLRDLSVVEVSSNEEAFTEVGFKNERNRHLAFWHEVAGAGKSKRKHKIMGVLPEEEDELAELAETEIVKTLKKWSMDISQKYSG